MLTHLHFGSNLIGAAETESFAGVLGQCTEPAHLDRHCDSIDDAVAEGLPGVLGQCASLAHLDLSDNNDIDTAERGFELLGSSLPSRALPRD
jgi:hypothetical protein